MNTKDQTELMFAYTILTPLFLCISNEGMVKKSLSITPIGSDSGYFVNISK
jgi:hypothetical protein